MVPDSRKRPVTIVDSTLIECALTPGIDISPSEKIRIADLLVEAGVNEIEAGIPSHGVQASRQVRDIMKRHPQTRITCWIRATEEALEDAARCSVGSVHMSIPALKLRDRSDRDARDYINRKEALIIKAFEYFDSISLGITDTLHADFILVLRLVAKSLDVGVHRIRVTDTMGIREPSEIGHLVSELVAKTSGEVEFHGHNTRSQALQNSLAALDAGAGALSLAAGSLVKDEDRPPTLEDLASALRFSDKYRTTLDYERIDGIHDELEKILADKVALKHRSDAMALLNN